MPEDYEFRLIHEDNGRLQPLASRPVSLRGKVLCGVIGGLIVMGVASRFDKSYAEAEAAGATQMQIVEAEAEVEKKVKKEEKMMRGASGSATKQHDWVFGD